MDASELLISAASVLVVAMLKRLPWMSAQLLSFFPCSGAACVLIDF
jgi:hypothetical protein